MKIAQLTLTQSSSHSFIKYLLKGSDVPEKVYELSQILQAFKEVQLYRLLEALTLKKTAAIQSSQEAKLTSSKKFIHGEY